MDVATILIEVLTYAPTAIKLGMDVVGTIERAIELYKRPAAATPDALAQLQAQIAQEKAQLTQMTAQLDQDP